MDKRFTIESIKDRLCLNNKGRTDRGLPYADSDISQLVSYCESMLMTLKKLDGLDIRRQTPDVVEIMKEAANIVEKHSS